MKDGFLLEYFEQAQGFKRIKDVICVLCDATVEIRSLQGDILQCCSTQFISPHIPPVTVSNDSYHCSSRTDDCVDRNAKIIELATSTREPQVASCPKGQKYLLIPILLKERFAGFLVIWESPRFKLSRAQVRAVINLLMDLISDVDKNELSEFENAGAQPLTYQQKHMNRVIEYIHKNYHQVELSLKTVARDNNISYHYLSHLFKQEMSCSFSQYLNQLRLDVATRLLQNRGLSVGEVAYACGYEDPGYFCKVFKKQFQMTPLAFRESSPRSRLPKIAPQPQLVLR